MLSIEIEVERRRCFGRTEDERGESAAVSLRSEVIAKSE